MVEEEEEVVEEEEEAEEEDRTAATTRCDKAAATCSFGDPKTCRAVKKEIIRSGVQE